MRTPNESIEAALRTAISKLDESASKDDRMRRLSIAIIECLAQDGYLLIDKNLVWTFEDALERWLNQDYDAYRLGEFTPYRAWLDVMRLLPPRPITSAKHDEDQGLLGARPPPAVR
jgi:hypothetical protein